MNVSWKQFNADLWTHSITTYSEVLSSFFWKYCMTSQSIWQNIVMLYQNSFKPIIQHQNIGTEGEIVIIFHIWSGTELVTLNLGAHLETVVAVKSLRCTVAQKIHSTQLSGAITHSQSRANESPLFQLLTHKDLFLCFKLL